MRLRFLLALSVPIWMSACVAAPSSGTDPEATVDDTEAGDEPTAEAAQAVCIPGGQCCDFNPLGQLYWGELHLHTSLSLDAWTKGTRVFPADAYQFAKGAASVQIASGSTGGPGATVSQPRPLDFMAVTDHAEFLSVQEECVINTGGPQYNSAYCIEVRDQRQGHQEVVGAHPLMAAAAYANCPFGDPTCVQSDAVWPLIVNAAQTANDPCHFTAFAGYEWTGSPSSVSYSAPPGWWPAGLPPVVPDITSYTTHRNVIFANNNVPLRVFDAFRTNSDTAPELWQQLDTYCTGTCDAVTIPHNSNQSHGLSLTVDTTIPGTIARQKRYQVAAEVFQHKGNSECDPVTSTSDPDCEFEHISEGLGEPQSFIRTALKTGLSCADDASCGNGDNPLELGMVAASDDHNGTASMVNDASWPGHAGWEDLSPSKRLTHVNNGSNVGPGGITGVWARENTREEIFAAIKRRETYATSGPRLKVRMFQSANPNPCTNGAFPLNQFQDGDGDGLMDGVPMGGEFTAANLAAGANPVVLAIMAYPDPQNQALPGPYVAGPPPSYGTWGVATIAQVQVIKVYSDGAGGTFEDAPSPVAGFPAGGGCRKWVDPNFNPNQRAAYYVRVLQVPTWRWTHHDCMTAEGLAAFPAQCAPGGAFHQTVEERAWTSPVWFVPGP